MIDEDEFRNYNHIFKLTSTNIFTYLMRSSSSVRLGAGGLLMMYMYKGCMINIRSDILFADNGKFVSCSIPIINVPLMDLII